MDVDVETDDGVGLPSEFRIVQWKAHGEVDGEYWLAEVFFKDNKPWSYDDNWLFAESLTCGVKDRAELEAALARIAKGIAEAARNPVLNEETDFPGQERYEVHGFADLLKQSRQSAD